jgi:hypothetical protein
MKSTIHSWPYLAHFFVEWKTCQTKVVEEIKTHILCLVTFFENRAVNEIMWKNTVELDRPQMTIWCMRNSCWIPKATNTHSEYTTLIAFPLHNGHTNAPQSYVIRTLPVLLSKHNILMATASYILESCFCVNLVLVCCVIILFSFQVGR